MSSPTFKGAKRNIHHRNWRTHSVGYNLVLSLPEKQIAKIYLSSFTFSLMGLEHCKEIKGYLSSLFPAQFMPQRDMRDMCFH